MIVTRVETGRLRLTEKPGVFKRHIYRSYPDLVSAGGQTCIYPKSDPPPVYP